MNGEGLLGEKLTLRFLARTDLEHHFNFYPNLRGGGRYRMDGSASLNVHVASWLSLNSRPANHYLSQPIPGHRKNELLLTTGFGLHF